MREKEMRNNMPCIYFVSVEMFMCKIYWAGLNTAHTDNACVFNTSRLNAT